MEFQDQKAIYLQIAEWMEEAILNNKWQERIPAIRELASELKVNPNTVTRTYAYLESQGIITMQRGIGYFVGEGAAKKVKALRKQDFLEKTLPNLFKAMDLLGVTPDEILKQYQQR